MIFLTVILSDFNYLYLGLIVEHLYVVFSITVSVFFDIYQYFALGNYYILKLKTKFIIPVIKKLQHISLSVRVWIHLLS